MEIKSKYVKFLEHYLLQRCYMRDYYYIMSIIKYKIINIVHIFCIRKSSKGAGGNFGR